jgi:hypothetical protein
MKNWKITGVRTHSNTPELEDVVFSVQYQITTNSWNTAVFDSKSWINISYNSNVPFIPRNQITEEILLNWLKTTLGETKVTELEAELDVMQAAIDAAVPVEVE